MLDIPIIASKIKNDPRYEEFKNGALPHIDSLYRFALLYTGSSKNASKMMKVTYNKAFKFFDNFVEGANFKEWMFRIFKNIFIQVYREREKNLARADFEKIQADYDELKKSGSVSPKIITDLFNQLSDKEIINIILTLPLDLKIAIILKDIEGFTYEEIATIVDCPIGTVQTRLYRARALLFTRLNNLPKKKDWTDRIFGLQ